MINYFTNQKIHWYRYSPKDIIFKSNPTTKKLLPEENVLSWTTKGNRDQKMCKKTGGKVHQYAYNSGTQYHYGAENYRSVHVQLEDLTRDYPQAKIQFIDNTNLPCKPHRFHAVDTLCEIRSMHYNHQYNYSTQNYTKTKIKCSDLEGYEFTIGGQGQGVHQNHRDWIEMGDINQAIINFILEMVIPLKQNDLKLCA